MKVGLCLFIVSFGGLLDLEGLVGAVNCVLLLVCFGEAGADVEVESNEVRLILFFKP